MMISNVSGADHRPPRLALHPPPTPTVPPPTTTTTIARCVGRAPVCSACVSPLLVALLEPSPPLPASLVLLHHSAPISASLPPVAPARARTHTPALLNYRAPRSHARAQVAASGGVAAETTLGIAGRAPTRQGPHRARTSLPRARAHGRSRCV